MTIRLSALVVCLLVPADLWAAGEPQFEVASLKPAPKWNGAPPYPMPVFRGGPGSADPTRLTVRNLSLRDLILRAYAIEGYQLSAPAWIAGSDFLSDNKIEIDATIATGTTKEQFLAMLQNLLIERFAMKAHREQKEGLVYSLIQVRSGHKLKPNLSVELADPPAAANQRIGPDGFQIMPPGYTGLQVKPPARNDLRFIFKMVRYSVPKLAELLTRVAGHPVIDRTGLQGNFDCVLEYRPDVPEAAEEADPAPDIYTAVQRQLGLRLAPDKGMIEMLVIDHAERVPAGN